MSIIIIIIISQPNCGTMKKKEKDSENLAVYAHDHELLLGKEICSMRSNEKPLQERKRINAQSRNKCRLAQWR